MNQKSCKACKKVYNQSRYQARREHIISTVIKWKNKNAAMVQGYRNSWNTLNPEKREESSISYSERIENRIWAAYTKMIRKSLNGYPFHFKDYREVIGSDKLILWRDLSSKLVKGMHRGNFGSRKLQWSIGFDIPVEVFDLRTLEGQRKAFGVGNLKPLWSRQKADKGESMGLREAA